MGPNRRGLSTPLVLASVTIATACASAPCEVVDDTCLLVRHTRRDGAGALVLDQVWTRASDGRVVSYSVVEPGAPIEERQTDTTWLDASRVELETEIDGASGEVLSETVHTWTTDGALQVQDVDVRGADGDTALRLKRWWDAGWREVRHEVDTDVDGVVDALYVYEYDEHGWLTRALADWLGDGSVVSDVRHVLDAAGNPVWSIERDETGQIVETTRRVYDACGRPTLAQRVPDGALVGAWAWTASGRPLLAVQPGDVGLRRWVWADEDTATLEERDADGVLRSQATQAWRSGADRMVSQSTDLDGDGSPEVQEEWTWACGDEGEG